MASLQSSSLLFLLTMMANHAHHSHFVPSSIITPSLYCETLQRGRGHNMLIAANFERCSILFWTSKVKWLVRINFLLPDSDVPVWKKIYFMRAIVKVWLTKCFETVFRLECWKFVGSRWFMMVDKDAAAWKILTLRNWRLR